MNETVVSFPLRTSPSKRLGVGRSIPYNMGVSLQMERVRANFNVVHVAWLVGGVARRSKSTKSYLQHTVCKMFCRTFIHLFRLQGAHGERKLWRLHSLQATTLLNILQSEVRQVFLRKKGSAGSRYSLTRERCLG